MPTEELKVFRLPPVLAKDYEVEINIKLTPYNEVELLELLSKLGL